MAIAFKRPELESEFQTKLHPATRAVVVELSSWLERAGYPGIMLTEVCRTEAQNRLYYKGKNPFSWHLVNRAVDIRNRCWTVPQRHAILLFLQINWPDAEVLMHDVVGAHLHIAWPAPNSRYRRLSRWITRKKATK